MVSGGATHVACCGSVGGEIWCLVAGLRFTSGVSIALLDGAGQREGDGFRVSRGARAGMQRVRNVRAMDNLLLLLPQRRTTPEDSPVSWSRQPTRDDTVITNDRLG